MHLRRFFISVLLLIFCVQAASAQNDDGIPDNCENTRAVYFRDGLFARYEPQNSRLVLVDWGTGVDVMELASNLDDTLIRGWSWDCQYLAVATGSSQSRATVVYDTLTGERVGEVPDARVVPHTITWGPESYLVVETRNGAVVWDVPHKRQYHYDTGFHTTLHRNFTQLRWDAENRHLTANLAVGGRLVIDLTTGQETIAASSRNGEIVIGGERFLCQRGNYYNYETYARSVFGLWLDYAPEGGVIYLRRGYGGRQEVMATIEANVEAMTIQNLGWSANCRYLAAAIRVPNQDDVWQTVVWEFETRRRVGVFEDAHDIPHPITWDTAEKHMLVQTRDGAYLWSLETNERVLVTDSVAQVCTGYYSCGERMPKSFYSVYWDAGRQQLLAVPIANPDSVVAYDVNSGKEIARYTVEGASHPVAFITSNDSRLLIIYADNRASLWNRESGTQTILDFAGIDVTPTFSQDSAISTNNRYFAYVHNSVVYVWDLTVPNQNMTPTTVFQKTGLWPLRAYFVNGDTLDMGNPYQQARINVATGEVYKPATFNPETQAALAFNSLDGTSGYGVAQPYGYRWYQEGTVAWANCPAQPFYNGESRQLFLHDVQTDDLHLIADDLNDIRFMELSPDCRTLYTEIQLLNTNLPYDETPATVSRSDYRRWVRVTLWDVVSGQAFLTFDEPPQTRVGRSRVWWSPDSDRALLRTGSREYVVDVHGQTAVPLVFIDTPDGYLPYNTEVYWDYSRGLIYVEGFGEVFAVDMLTGIERLRFPAQENQRGGCYYNASRGCNMQLSPDGQWLFVYGNVSMSAWNIDTLQHAFVPVASPADEQGGYISPDGRYLVVARSAVRVWDITNLPGEFKARQPISTFGVGAESIMSLDFVNSSTIEVTIPTEKSSSTMQFDILTGTQVEEG